MILPRVINFIRKRQRVDSHNFPYDLHVAVMHERRLNEAKWGEATTSPSGDCKFVMSRAVNRARAAFCAKACKSVAINPSCINGAPNKLRAT